MLNSLRDNFKNRPYLKWILIAVAVSMVLYLADAFDLAGPGAGSDWAARVNGNEIPVRRFINAARNLDQYYRQLFGDRFDELRSQIGIGQQAVEALIEQELVRQDARSLGLIASKTELADQIRSHPSLQDPSGQFVGTERYVQVMNRYPGGIPEFERSISDALVAELWTDLVTQPVAIGERELENEFRRRTEKTSANYFVVVPEAPAEDVEVPEAELTAWYEGHPADYQQGEGRRIVYFVVERAALEDQVEIPEAQVLAAYEQDRDRFTTPEQRRVSHVLIRVAADASDEDKQAARQRAEDALTRARAGEDFSELARELSEDETTAPQGGDLGFFGRGAMVPAFETASWNTPVGELAEVTETPFGFHVLRITDSREPGVIPLDDVRESIERRLMFQATADRVQTDAQRLADEVDSVESLEQVARREGLTVVRRVVREGDQLNDLGAAADFSAVMLTSNPGDAVPPMRVATGQAVIAIEAAIEAGLAPLEEVRDDIRREILEGRAREESLAGARRALEDNAEFDAVASALSATVQDSGELSPGQGLPGVGAPTPEVVAAIFGDPAAVGDRGVLPVPGGALVYEITARVPFDAERFVTEKEPLRRDLLVRRRSEFRQSVLDTLRSSQKVEINFELVQSVNG